MDLPTEKQDILARIEQSHARWRELVSGLTAAQLLAPGAAGDWSARDVVAHIAAGERWLAGQLAAYLRGEAPGWGECYGGEFEALPPGISLETQDGRNAWQHQRLQALTLDEVRELTESAHPKLAAVLEQIPAKIYSEPFSIGGNGPVGQIRPATPGEAGFPLWRWVAGATYLHYEDHGEQLRRFVMQGPAR